MWDDDITGFNFEGRLLGSGGVPLIHFDIVEFQMPDRVMRQFGFMQGIPSTAKNHGDLRKEKKFKFIDVEDCMALRGEYISRWEAYMDHLEGQQTEISDYVPIDDYMVWYRKITRWKIHRPRQASDLDSCYEPRAIYNQQHLIKMV